MFFSSSFCVCFCHFLIQSCQKYTFFFRPFTQNFADSMSIISDTKKMLVIKNEMPPRFVFVKTYMKRTPSIFFGFQSLLVSRNSFCIYMKSTKISSKSDPLPSISKSGVDFEHILNKFLEDLGLRVMSSQKYYYYNFFFLSIPLPKLDS